VPGSVIPPATRALSPSNVRSSWGRAEGRAGETHRMSPEARFERRLDRWVARATRPRGAAIVIASVTTAITVVSGLLMTLIDHEGFPSLGAGLWWAVQTVTTVGYGDHVPATGAGQVLAALIMLLGIGFITVITASITSSFVARLNQRQEGADADATFAEQLQSIDERLARIEASLNDRS
jgi:voltage-gated potassium channel